MSDREEEVEEPEEQALVPIEKVMPDLGAGLGKLKEMVKQAKESDNAGGFDVSYSVLITSGSPMSCNAGRIKSAMSFEKTELFQTTKTIVDRR